MFRKQITQKLNSELTFHSQVISITALEAQATTLFCYCHLHGFDTTGFTDVNWDSLLLQVASRQRLPLRFIIKAGGLRGLEHL